MFSIKRSHALIAVLSLLVAAVVVKEVYPSIITASASKKTVRRFVLRNVQNFYTTIEISTGVPYVVATGKRFVITDITICNTDDDADGHAVLLTDQANPGTSTIHGDLCVRAGENVHVNYTIGPQIIGGQGLTFANSGGSATPMNAYISGYEEKGS